MAEHDEQKAFFEWVEYSKIPGIDLMHATPNGGKRHPAVAKKLKAEGVKPGVPDVSWPVARGGFIGLAIEFKHGDGTPTKEQRERITRLQEEALVRGGVLELAGGDAACEGLRGVDYCGGGMNEKQCTWCGHYGHRASHCPRVPRLPSQSQERTLGPSSLSVLAVLREFGGEHKPESGVGRSDVCCHITQSGRARQGADMGAGQRVVARQEAAALNLMECFG